MGYFVPETAPAKSDPTAKNRVGGFFADANGTRPANRRQSPQPRREIRPAPTKPASGIPFWPSRDPIGERSGINVYGFVGNAPVDRTDYLGMLRAGQKIKVYCTIGEKKKLAGTINVVTFGVIPAGTLNGKNAGQGKLEMKFMPFSPKDPKDCCCAEGKYRWYQTIVRDDEGGKVPRPDVGGGKGSPNLAPSYNLHYLDMPTLFYSTLDAIWHKKRKEGKNQQAKAMVEFRLELQCENEESIETYKTIEWGLQGTLDVNVKRNRSDYKFKVYETK